MAKDCSDTALSATYRLLNGSWKKVAVVFTGVVLLLVFSFSLFTQLKFTNKVWYRLPAPCQTRAAVMADMKTLLVKIHQTLDKLGIPHVVCYGTLWGTLRNGQILPWDNNVDFCVNAVHIVKYDRQWLAKEFAKNAMILSYISKEGYYEVKYKSASGYITTFLEHFNGDMFRTGWIHHIRWWFDKNTVSFPAELMEAPLSTVKLEGKDMPVPHENIEILKYLYPDDWWLEVKPPGC